MGPKSLFLFRQNDRSVIGDGHGVFILNADGAVDRTGCPPVFVNLCAPTAEGEHWFNGENHARFQEGPGIGKAEMGNLGLFPEFTADTMAGELPDDSVAEGFCKGLYGVADVSDPAAGSGLFNAEEQCFLTILHESADLRGDLTHGIGPGGVTMIAFIAGSDVDRDHIAFFQRLGAGKTVADLIIESDADGRGKTMMPLETGCRPAFSDMLFHQGVQIPGVHPGADGLAHQGVTLGNDGTGLAHDFQFIRRFRTNHAGHHQMKSAVGAEGVAWVQSTAKHRRKVLNVILCKPESIVNR